MSFQGKTALVTGASRGIGRAIALALAQQGLHRIILVARNAQHLAEVAAEITDLGVEAVSLPLDLTQPVVVNIVIAQAWQRHGPIHLLVNCAGIAHQVPFLEAHVSQAQEEIALNLIGTYTVTRLIAKRMVSKEEGRIVNVSSLMGKLAAPTMATYCATKFALLGFTQALRSELAAHNIQVMAFLPSLTDTDMTRDLRLFRWVIPMTPQKVAQAFVASLDRNTAEILVGWQSHLAVWCHRIAPGLLAWLIRLAAPGEEKQNASPLVMRPAGTTHS
ncbi:SDR family NAD(P)-dependent oxidoreductase [Lyngbya confervoides]|uniref:SDR family NAD(P)-dependent oxidoreductase n=1 Tax=Lyngbya confervoides BDU141951 TaxID=1574623 RepID=A0ABD4T5J0_9CYAN|nr:SDR family NAD(P)-dependent oxidoreductase [Lyngbya confervoides]MCM1983896.1 SDR family NAD(P)-dependent oxidoreductase [Lyngbya confervoides BDU141951]